jgi:hypothetical protein
VCEERWCPFVLPSPIIYEKARVFSSISIGESKRKLKFYINQQRTLAKQAAVFSDDEE